MLGERLKELRKRRNLRQLDIAEMLGVSRTTYTQYEIGLTEPDIDTIKKLAQFFGVSTDVLLGNQEKHKDDISVDPDTLIIFNRAAKELPPDALQRLKEYAAREIEYELMKREMDKDKK